MKMAVLLRQGYYGPPCGLGLPPLVLVVLVLVLVLMLALVLVLVLMLALVLAPNLSASVQGAVSVERQRRDFISAWGTAPGNSGSSRVDPERFRGFQRAVNR